MFVMFLRIRSTKIPDLEKCKKIEQWVPNVPFAVSISLCVFSLETRKLLYTKRLVQLSLNLEYFLRTLIYNGKTILIIVTFLYVLRFLWRKKHTVQSL